MQSISETVFSDMVSQDLEQEPYLQCRKFKELWTGFPCKFLPGKSQGAIDFKGSGNSHSRLA